MLVSVIRKLEVLKGTDRISAIPNTRFAIAAYHKLPDRTPQSIQVMSNLRAKGFETQADDEDKFVYVIRGGTGAVPG